MSEGEKGGNETGAKITLYTVFVYGSFTIVLFGRLLVLSLNKEDYLHILKCVLCSLHSVCGKWKGWVPMNRFYSN